MKKPFFEEDPYRREKRFAAGFGCLLLFMLLLFGVMLLLQEGCSVSGEQRAATRGLPGVQHVNLTQGVTVMEDRDVLVVDDEKNIRLTLSEALRDLDLKVDTAAGGEEALSKLEASDYGLILLDIRMPGMDGMEVLRRARKMKPLVPVIMITAHGTVENAVGAMKLGAVDFIRKPFSASEIRALVQAVQARERLDPEQAEHYDDYIELARRGITSQQFETARMFVNKALASDEERPEAYNLLGVLHEIDGDHFEAQQCYRKALEKDAAYESARVNLHQSVDTEMKGSFMLDETKKENAARSSR